MALPSDLLSDLEDMPRQLERALRLIPLDRLGWKPESWGGSPGETFSALEHVCHLRDIVLLAGIQFLAGKIASDL